MRGWLEVPMEHVYRHPEHTLHFGQLHFDEWIGLIGTAALIAAFVVGVVGFEFTGLMVDPNIAP